MSDAKDPVYAERMRIREFLIWINNGNCFWCNSHRDYRLHLHEIVTRQMTLNNEEARAISFQRELVSLLCPECHEMANTYEMRRELLAINVIRYGRKAVEDRLEQLRRAMKTPLPVQMPDEEMVKRARQRRDLLTPRKV